MLHIFLCLLLAASSSPARAFILDGCNRHCNVRSCPTACQSEVPDPCACCPFVCASMEGEPCGAASPCERNLVCRDFNNERVCTCAKDNRMICGTDSVTYDSICQFNRANETGKLSIQHWGPCEFKPEIVSAPEDKKIKIGGPLFLDCEAKGFPIPTITWSFMGRDGNTRQLPSDDQLIAVQLRGGPAHLMVTSWVQIYESRHSDLGYYVCEAWNSLGSVRAEASVTHHRR